MTKFCRWVKPDAAHTRSMSGTDSYSDEASDDEASTVYEGAVLGGAVLQAIEDRCQAALIALQHWPILGLFWAYGGPQIT